MDSQRASRANQLERQREIPLTIGRRIEIRDTIQENLLERELRIGMRQTEWEEIASLAQ